MAPVELVALPPPTPTSVSKTLKVLENTHLLKKSDVFVISDARANDAKDF